MIRNDCHFIREYLKDRIINDLSEHDGIYKEEKQQISNIIKNTINKGESNSALIVGPRGAGKTNLVKEILKNLVVTTNLNSNAILIELNGLIHTDDKIALKSCTKQMNLDERSECFGGTFAEHLAFLLDCLKTGNRQKSKSLIFVVEEFDLFCNHNNQTLLYNLFDMTHKSDTCLCVIGITSRLDIIELFEKRVKSRFSHRLIYLFPSQFNSNTIETVLSIDEEDQSIHQSITTTNVSKVWNHHLKTQFLLDHRFTQAMARLNQLTNCQRIFNNILLCLVSELNNNDLKLSVEKFVELCKEYENDDKIRILNSLSVVEICLIIAMKHHTEIYDNQPFNFQMIFERYKKFLYVTQTVAVLHRSVLFKAFEHIKNLELIAAVQSSSNGHRQKEYELYDLVLQCEQIEKAFDNNRLIPTEVHHWLKSSSII